MTRMATLSLAGGLALMLVGVEAGAGGGPKDGGERMQMRLQRMKEALSLTDDQATQIEAIFKQTAAQAEADRAKGGSDPEGLRSLARERHRKTAEKIDAVLTEEQKAKHAQLREQFRRSHGRDRFHGRPGGPAGPAASPVPDVP
jgi:Spy/CpxP family protein refolding chaperone